jgi:hypothetical protein
MRHCLRKAAFRAAGDREARAERRDGRVFLGLRAEDRAIRNLTYVSLFSSGAPRLNQLPKGGSPGLEPKLNIVE